MKLTKMLGLVAVTAVAAMALIGASSASANPKLCKVKTSPCPAGEAYTLPLTVNAHLETGTLAELQTSLLTDKCKVSTVKLTAKESNATAIVGTLETITFSECTCKTSQAVSVPWAGSLTAGTEGNGTLLASNGGTGNPGGLVVCPTILGEKHCTYRSADPKVTFDGGVPAKVLAAVPLTKAEGAGESDGSCPATATWKATYVVEPSPMWVTAA